MLKKIEFPQYLDVLLIIDDNVTKAKIYKVLDRSKDYLTKSLRYLEAHGLIIITQGERRGKTIRDYRTLQITLTPKGRDVQNIIVTLYNIMGLRL
jgi:DNA-binding HxlR family transcriptional regulator